MSVFLIANEAANAGRAAGLISAARAALEQVGGAQLLLTKTRGDEARCAQEAITHGATAVAVLGGDGTISRVACELVRAKSSIPLAVFGAGTGNDFAKSLAAPIHDFRAMADLISVNRVRTIDAGIIDNTIFINSAGFGFDADIVAKSLETGRLQGKAKYAATAITELFQYRGFEAGILSAELLTTSKTPRSVVISEFHTHSFSPNPARRLFARWLTIVFANGKFFGGAFRIAPAASLEDGLLDAVFVRDAAPWRRAAIFARALGGNHVREPEVGIGRNSRWSIEFSEPPVYQADGELWQATSATVDVAVLPAALRLVG
ncbi:MAG: diacylglycerol kinase family protein [Gemmatimonas sp.]